MFICISGLIPIVRNINKTKLKENNIEEISQETIEKIFEDENGNKYIVKYSEKNLGYEIYDENGVLVTISPTESGVKEYVENSELVQNLE